MNKDPKTNFDTSQIDALAAAETESLEIKFQVLYSVIAARNKAMHELHEKIMVLEKEMEVITEPFDNQIQKLQEEIQEDVKYAGKSFKCPFGKATYKKAYERHSWDDKALMGYAAVNPVIEQFRKTSLVPASVSVSVGDMA